MEDVESAMAASGGMARGELQGAAVDGGPVARDDHERTGSDVGLEFLDGEQAGGARERLAKH